MLETVIGNKTYSSWSMGHVCSCSKQHRVRRGLIGPRYTTRPTRIVLLNVSLPASAGAERKERRSRCGLSLSIIAYLAEQLSRSGL